ncbi:MAG: hypothetical protein ACRDJU_08415 [Actinomycetota bacterium]
MSRTRDARRLEWALSDHTRIPVRVEWDGSTRWAVTWQGGPTVANMRPIVERFIPTVAPTFVGLPLNYARGQPVAAWARVLIEAARAGRPAEIGWELERTIDEREYPEVPASAEEAELVARLMRLASEPVLGGHRVSEYRMAELLALGLGVLGAGELPPGVTSIDDARRARAVGTGALGYVCPVAATHGVRVTAATEGVPDRAACLCGAAWSRPAGDEYGDTLGEWTHGHPGGPGSRT